MQTIDYHSPGWTGASMNKIKPYVGVTGITKITEAKSVVDLFYKYRRGKKHRLMVGFLVSKKGLLAREKLTGGSRYPSLEEMPALLEASGYDDVIRTIHYHSKGRKLCDEIERVMDQDGITGSVEAVQFNVKFPPDEDEIRSVLEDFPGMEMILQANEGALSFYDGNPEGFANLVSARFAGIHHVLIDPSGGRGIEMDVLKMVSFYETLKKTMPKTSVGFAGGLGPENIFDIVNGCKVLLNTDDFSVDAETKLRDGADVLDLDRVEVYMRDFFAAI